MQEGQLECSTEGGTMVTPRHTFSPHDNASSSVSTLYGATWMSQFDFGGNDGWSAVVLIDASVQVIATIAAQPNRFRMVVASFVGQHLEN